MRWVDMTSEEIDDGRRAGLNATILRGGGDSHMKSRVLVVSSRVLVSLKVFPGKAIISNYQTVFF